MDALLPKLGELIVAGGGHDARVGNRNAISGTFDVLEEAATIEEQHTGDSRFAIESLRVSSEIVNAVQS